MRGASWLLLLAACGGPTGWPPAAGREYPDLTCRDGAGNEVRLSSFRGRVILVEVVGMS